MESNIEKELKDAWSSIRNLPMYGTGGTFLDLGANIGEVSKKASVKFKKVIAVEAHPVTFRRMQSRIGKIRNIQLICAAVSSQTGNRMWVSNPKNSTGATTNLKRRCRNVKNYYVATTSIAFQELLTKFRPRVIKMDIEGSEYEALESCKINSECEWLSVEFHNTRTPKLYKRFVNIRRRLVRWKFKMVKPSNISLLPDGTATKTLYFIAIFFRNIKNRK